MGQMQQRRLLPHKTRWRKLTTLTAGYIDWECHKLYSSIAHVTSVARVTVAAGWCFLSLSAILTHTYIFLTGNRQAAHREVLVALQGTDANTVRAHVPRIPCPRGGGPWKEQCKGERSMLCELLVSFCFGRQLHHSKLMFV